MRHFFFVSSDSRNGLLTVRIFLLSYNITSIFSVKPSNDRRPHVKINRNNKDNSGSVISILGKNSHKTFLKLGFSLLDDSQIVVHAAGEQKLKCKGYILLTVIFHDQEHVNKMHVVPDVESALILGVDFSHKFNILHKYFDTVISL